MMSSEAAEKFSHPRKTAVPGKRWEVEMFRSRDAEEGVSLDGLFGGCGV